MVKMAGKGPVTGPSVVFRWEGREGNKNSCLSRRVLRPYLFTYSADL